ncbi:hypothetical protein ZYGR_0E01390 [Zygosaccharomyces rouxii]|nr:hypothetical protein ZYGR_0E01390 [Zygosaccharomyces rouxii]
MNTVPDSLSISSPKDDEGRSRSSTLNTLPTDGSNPTLNGSSSSSGLHHINTNQTISSSNNNSKKQRQKLVLSTSFLSTKRLDNVPPSPASPLQGKRPTTSLNKALQGLKTEINQLQQQLSETRRSKEEAEHIRDSTGSEIYSGAYSTDHLQKHSMRIKANTQIRELDKFIKKMEKKIADLKLQFEHTKRSRELYCVRDHPRSLPREDIPVGLRSPQESVKEHSLEQTLMAHDSPVPQEDNFTLRSSHDQHETTLSDDHSSEVPTESDEDEPNAKNIETATWLVSGYMQSLQDKNSPADFVLKKSNGLVTLLKQHPEIRGNLLLDSFIYTIQAMLLNEDRVVVSCGYRICRYLIDGEEFIQEMLRLHIDVCLIMSFAKDFSFQMEREQALRLVRTFLEHRAGITLGIVQAVISCVEKQEDPLRNMAIETLLEFCFVCPEVVSECHGMRVLEGILQDPPFPMASIILDTILQLMSMHATRVHFLNDFDISVLVTSFSDTNTKSALNVEKMQNTCLLITKALKDYNGFMLFSMDNFKPLKELLSFFQVPMCAQYLIDIFLDVLRIKQLSYDKNRAHFKQVSLHFSRESMLINQHIALLILMMYHSNFGGQIWALIDQKKDQGVSSTLISKGRLLLAEYINLAANLLDVNVFDVKGLPPTWEPLIYDETYQFGKLTYTMNRNRNKLGVAGIDYGKPVKSFLQNMTVGTLNREVDDIKFRKMVFDSRVLQTKEFNLWNWNVIQELLEGPLLNDKHLDELARSTKFIRRLLIFYRPLRMRFANVNRGSRLSQRYVQAGCQFFHMLTSSTVGMRIFMDDTKIIPQLASLLFRAMEGHTVGNIFNLRLLSSKMVVGYFKFIGVLTQSGNGIAVLTRWNFFTVIYKMFQPKSKISSTFLLLTLPELDLRYSRHCRTIMSKALVNSDKHTRIKATEYLGEKLKSLSCLDDTATQDSETSKDNDLLRRYIVEMLTRQLYDLSPQVVAIADQALYEYVVKNESSHKLGSSLHTSLNQLVFIRSPIIFELLGTKNGFQLLNEINFVQEERKSWLATKNKEYVFLVENFLDYNQHGTFSNSSRRMTGIDRLPQHFYESLAKTEDGITLIGQSRDLATFISIIKAFRQTLKYPEDAPVNDIINLKSSLWCVGYIGSTMLGIGLLDEYSVVEDMIQIAYYASITSVRFTALLALGLISKTTEGCEILDEMGWSCCLNVQGSPMGITFPSRLDKFLSYNEKRWIAQGEYKEPIIEFDTKFGRMLGDIKPINLNLRVLLDEKTMMENPLEDGSLQDLMKTEERFYTKAILNQQRQYSNEEEKIIDEVLTIISQLGNHILSGNAIKGITELNKKYGSSLFESEIMFYKILDMMAQYRFKPHVRKFLCGLSINKKALENVIRVEKRRNSTKQC